MTASEIVGVVLTLLPIFFKNNPTVTEIEAVLPQVMAAIDGAKTGSAFSVTFPLAVDGKPGNASFGWSPSA